MADGTWQAALTDHQTNAYAHGPAFDRLHIEEFERLRALSDALSDHGKRLTRLEKYQERGLGGLIVLSALLAGGLFTIWGHAVGLWK